MKSILCESENQTGSELLQVSEVSHKSWSLTIRSIIKRLRSYRRRSLDELNVLDDFLMSAAASDPEGGPEFCRLLLSALLERQIGKVKVSTQKFLNSYTPELHGVRLDVEVIEPLDSGGPVANIYDIEPCLYNSDLETLTKRNRYYQGRIDGQYLKSGEQNYSRLPNLYVITILPYDPFGQGLMVYQFRNMCRELPELDYPDGLQYIYFREGNEPKSDLSGLWRLPASSILP